jgi:hypothetical protein
MEKKTRTRKHRAYIVHHGSRSELYPILDTDYYNPCLLQTTQVTESEGHPYHLLGRSDVDLGGEFFSSDYTYSDNCPVITVWSGPVGNSAFRTGPIFPGFDSTVGSIAGLAPLSQSSNALLDAAGTTAIANTIPTNPATSLATTFGELREGLPKRIGSTLFKDELRTAKKLGDEYLNVEFGWKPLVADIQNWIKAHKQADKIYQQLLRDSGRHVRRHFAFPKTQEIIESTVSTQFPAGENLVGLGSFFQGSGHYDLFKEVSLERTRWFSGAFTYWLEADASSLKTWRGHLRRLDAIYGVKITPDVLWNLAPWSWAVDWFTNTGDIMTNISRFGEDGLVMRYGYIMEKSIKKVLFRMNDVTPKGYHLHDLTQVLHHSVKFRRKATPFGFGLDEGSFTPRQWAIIAALGLSRSR